MREKCLLHPTGLRHFEKNMTLTLITFWWEWRCESPFWPSNGIAHAQYGYGEISPADLGLPDEIVEKLAQLGRLHDASLNWEYPPDPGPWRQAECDLFNQESKALFQLCRDRLPPHILLIYEHKDLMEDPDLDRYLADPKNFSRERLSLNVYQRFYRFILRAVRARN